MSPHNICLSSCLWPDCNLRQWFISDVVSKPKGKRNTGKGWYTYDVQFKGGGGGGGQDKNEVLSEVVGWEASECSGGPILIFFIKENWICAMTRHHADNISLARNLPFDSDVRQWSDPLTPPAVFRKMYYLKKWWNPDFLWLLIL